MQKNNLNSILSVLLLSCIIWVVSANKYFVEEKATIKTEQNKKKETQKFVKITQLSEATVHFLGFKLDAALHFVFETSILPFTQKVKFVDLVPRVRVSYWEKLFVSNIIVNAP